jgi:uncharacterized protein
MSGETELFKLLQNLKPLRHPGEYVFCLVDSYERVITIQPVCVFQEKEGITVIIAKEQADAMSLPYSVSCAWITLTVHSSLEAVGLTAAVSQALSKENISCNMVAAYYHDHLFVPAADAERAIKALLALTEP